MFSVIIPYYKKRKYIERCLDSVLAQTYTDYEIILVDDGSEDDLAELIHKKYQDKVKLITQKNQGVSAARNIGIVHAKGDYIALLDADDCWNPKYLEYANTVINSNRNVKIIGSKFSYNSNIIEENISSLEYKLIENYFSAHTVRNLIFLTSSTIINRIFFIDNVGFRVEFKSNEDIDVWFRVMISEGNAYQILNPLVYYSQEDINQITKQKIQIEESLLSSVFEIYKPLFLKYKDYDFEKFVNLYVLFKLLHFYNSKNYHKARSTFRSRTRILFLASLPYYAPLLVWNNKRYKKLALYYLKFLLRFVY